MSRCPVYLAPLVLLGFLTATPGCQRKLETPGGKENKPVVTVSQPREDEVTNYLYFTGRTEAVESVDVKCRVSGYLVQVAMKPGAVVHGPETPAELATSTLGLLGSTLAHAPILTAATLCPGRDHGELLFVIDPRPYQAELDRARGQVLLAEAKLGLAISMFEMGKEVARTNKGAISKQQLASYEAGQFEAEASLKAAQASLESFKLNLEFTAVTAPIAGRVSRTLLTVGNLVTKDESTLTTIVSEDPMHVYFDMDEQSLQMIQGLLRQGKIKSLIRGKLEVSMGLALDKGAYPYRGYVDFFNNKVDPSTGTITVRTVFANPRPETGPRHLLPGEFARIRMPLGDPYKAVLVSDKAIVSEQGKKYLLTLDGKNRVQKKQVTLGPLQDNGLRVVESGVTASDWVLLSGLHEAVPGKEVTPERVKMPVQAVPQMPGGSISPGQETPAVKTGTPKKK